ncbi:unnamed protein product [Chilo suppressalis]|uniref:FP protein C-terminal domain-containing protein n=1 Tax=Chilo suppressalis TaxID=168631 RepID=A0ABN8B7S7_CHISP|nr:unnamed protein product [Chilo suppressalis]
MPLRHSPRASPSRQTASAHESLPKATISRSASITSVATSDNDSSTMEGAVRKRKRSDEGIRELREEITQMFTSWKTEQDKKMAVILNTVNDIKAQNKDIQTSIELMSKNYDEILQRINKLEIERDNSLKYIKILENKIEIIERGQNCSRIELRGIPRKDAETKSDLIMHLQHLGEVLEVSVQSNEIRDVYRLNTKSETLYKPIIVEFHSVMKKEDILKSLKTFNRENKEKINTTKLQIDGPPAPVFISECLTPQTRKLFASARKFAKDNCYRYCWTSFGRIYLRKSEGDKLIRVDSDHDLDKLK